MAAEARTFDCWACGAVPVAGNPLSHLMAAKRREAANG